MCMYGVRIYFFERQDKKSDNPTTDYRQSLQQQGVEGVGQYEYF